MLRVIVCWSEAQVNMELRDLHDEHFKVNRSRRTAVKDKERVQVITQLNMLQRLDGYNPDSVEFECMPDTDEMCMAIERTRAKKGRVFIKGRLNYDHAKKANPVKASHKAVL